MDSIQAEPKIEGSEAISPLYTPQARQYAKRFAYIFGLVCLGKIFMLLNFIVFASPRVEALSDLSLILLMPWTIIIFCRIYTTRWLRMTAIVASPFLLYAQFTWAFPILFMADAVQTDHESNFELLQPLRISPNTRLCKYRVDFGAMGSSSTVLREETEIFPGILKLKVLKAERLD